MPLEGTKAVEKLTCLRKGVSELHRRPYSKVPQSKDSVRFPRQTPGVGVSPPVLPRVGGPEVHRQG